MFVYPAANTPSTSRYLRQAHPFITMANAHRHASCTGDILLHFARKNIGPYIFLTSPAKVRLCLVSTSSAE